MSCKLSRRQTVSSIYNSSLFVRWLANFLITSWADDIFRWRWMTSLLSNMLHSCRYAATMVWKAIFWQPRTITMLGWLAQPHGYKSVFELSIGGDFRTSLEHLPTRQCNLRILSLICNLFWRTWCFQFDWESRCILITQVLRYSCNAAYINFVWQ